MEHPIKIDDLRVSPILGNLHLLVHLEIGWDHRCAYRLLATPFTSESERRKEQNRNMEDMDFGCGEPCCGEPYLGFGRRMALFNLSITYSGVS